MSRIIYRGFATVNSNPKGRFQHWRKPVYHAPHVNPLEVGADFSFTNSRAVQFTSLTQVNNKIEQLRLAKQVIKALDEIRQAEAVHNIASKERAILAKKDEERRPIAKGTDLLS